MPLERRQPDDLQADGGDGSANDLPRPDLLAPIPRFGSPVQIPGTAEIYADGPQLSDDGLRLYFSSNSPGSAGERDIWVVKRTSNGMNDRFGPPENLAELNTADDEADPSLSADELVIVFERTPAGGTDDDLITASRTTRSAAFVPSPAVELNQQGVIDGDPGLTADGLRLYYATNWNQQGWGIYTTTRPDRRSPFTETPRRLPELSADLKGAVAPAPSGGLLFFAAGGQPLELYVAQLAPASPAPQALGAVNTKDNESDPYFSAAQGVLVFLSNRSGPSRLWWCQVQPTP